jgi:hypothetical protein
MFEHGSGSRELERVAERGPSVDAAPWRTFAYN